MDEGICDSQITGEYVSQHLKKAFGDKAILQSFHAELIGIDDGIVSKIMRLSLNWATKDDLPDTIVVKAPTLERYTTVMTSGNEESSFVDAATKWVPISHNLECAVYEIFKKECPIRIPKCYKTVPITEESHGMIIMEDLSQKAAIVPSLLDGLNYQQVLASITEIAHLQAWSLTTSIDWRSQLPSFQDLEDIMKSFLAPIISGVNSAKKDYPEFFGLIDLDKMSKILEWESYLEIMTEHQKYMDDVLIHGDFYKNNIMFEKNPDGPISDRLAAIIDFQGAMKASPAYDIARIFVCSVTPEFRHRHEIDILHHYYDTVKSIAGDKFKVSFDQLHVMYMRHLAMEALNIISWIPQMINLCIKSEGAQKEEDTQTFLSYVKDVFDHSISIFD